ncbi:hypothetical protein Cagg_1967 [Chloroflexus aggregans DSM 9485]|uniref:Uncharacterized protein n=1 Tax=Chloroflexus aggregans (strain MD-66 / DSM 9485) TaxID=326427 RepID=B8GBP4_CHLAD|nr:hypothetical protein Cagg_1967 [Chloroflexus aggregans DSM 9485]
MKQTGGEVEGWLEVDLYHKACRHRTTDCVDDLTLYNRCQRFLPLHDADDALVVDAPSLQCFGPYHGFVRQQCAVASDACMASGRRLPLPLAGLEWAFASDARMAPSCRAHWWNDDRSCHEMQAMVRAFRCPAILNDAERQIDCHPRMHYVLQRERNLLVVMRVVGGRAQHGTSRSGRGPRRA